MKVGYIDYLNSYPFYHQMFQKQSFDGVSIVPNYPGELNKLMAKDELDLSPISAAAFPEMQDKLLVLPDFCISSVGYVKSVVLYSKIPIEELDGKSVGLTSASKTSVNLLKILLEKFYNIKPIYETVNPNPSFDNIDAALVIGNDAMGEASEPIQYTYDLGDLWLRKTGYPVVFALFVVRKDVVANNTNIINKITSSYSDSLKELYEDGEKLIKAASEKYPKINYDIKHYFSLLKYNFTDELKEAVMFYFNEATKLGLLEKVKEIHYYE